MKNNMKKLISISLLFAITACGNNTSSSSSTSKTSGSTNTVSESLSTSSSTSTTTISSSSTSSSSSSSSSTSSSSSYTSFVDEEKLKIVEAIEEGISNKDKVASGVFTNVTTKTKTVNYEFGNDNYGRFVHFDLEDYDEYYGYNKDKVQYGIKKEFKVVSKINIEEGEMFVNGPAVKPYDVEVYGAEGYMSYMLDMMQENKNKDYQNLVSENGYKFSVGKATTVGTKNYVWVNTVEFKLKDGAFENINVSMEKYSNVSINFNTNSYYINAGAKPVSTYKITYEQVIDTANATNPFDIETLYFDSFDLVDDNNNVLGNTLNMMAGVSPEFSISNIAPSTANINIDKIQFKVLEGSNDINGSYNSSTKKYKFSCAIPGTYKVELSTYRVKKEITVEVSDPLPETMIITNYTYTGGDFNPNLISADGKVIDLYVGSETYLSPSITPSLADQSTVLEVTSDNKDNLTYDFLDLKVNDTGKTVKAYKVIASQIGTYDLTIKSSLNENVAISLQLNVIEPPNFEDLIKERYVQTVLGELYVDVQFTPSSSDSKKGTVYVYDSYIENGPTSGTYNYEYDSTTRKFALTSNDGSEAICELFFDGSYKLTYNRLSTGATFALSVFSVRLMLANASWQGTIIAREFYVFEFNNSRNIGTFSYTRSNENFQTEESFECNISYSIEETEDGYNIKLSDDSIENMKKLSRITGVKSITFTKDFRYIVSILEINGEETVITHNRVRG